MNTARRGLGATAVLVLMALSACGGDNDESSSSRADDGSAQTNAPSGDKSLSGGGEAATDTTVDQPDATSAGNTTGVDLPSQPYDPLGRALIITMTVGVEVTDAAEAVDKVIALAGRHGGQLYNSDLDLTDPETAAGDLVFKLPPEQVQAFLTGLDPGIGRRTGMEGNTADVTKQLTDLDAQILTAATSVDRVRFLLAAAKTLDEVIRLEDELASRETHLEQLRAQKSNLDSQVALATITVHLTTAPPEEKAVVPESPKEEDDVSDAFRDGWEGFVKVLRGIALFVGYTAPFLAIGFIVAYAWWRISRRRPPVTTRSRSTAPPPPPAQDEDPHTSSPDSVGAARIP